MAKPETASPFSVKNMVISIEVFDIGIANRIGIEHQGFRALGKRAFFDTDTDADSDPEKFLGFALCSNIEL